MSACPDEATLDAFLSGSLSGERLRALDAHLDRCESCGALVGILAGGASGPRVASADEGTGEGADELAEGGRVGPYELRARIGEGASGIVWEAFEPRLRRSVALKVLRPERARDPRVRARLLREARAMARLAHPNVVAVFDAGEAGGRVYVAMEVVRGRTLRAWLAEGRRGWSAALDVMLQAGEGLAAAHDAGLVHRDFKPENVIVGDDGRTRVTDFGLAWLASAGDDAAAERAPLDAGDADRGDHDAALTATGAVLGTPAYMAPEQHDGRAADARADVFAFAVALWEALHGARPFAGDSRAAVRAAIARGPRPPARPGAPAWLARALAPALAEDPRDRPPSLRALLAALRAARDRRAALRRAAAPGALALALVAGVAAVSARRSAPAAATCAGGAREFAAAWDGARRDAVRAAFERTGAPYARAASDAVARAFGELAARWIAAYDGACRATRVDRARSESALDAQSQCLLRARDRAGALARALAQADAATVRGAARIADELPSVEACADARALLGVAPRPTDPAAREALARIERALAGAHAELLAGRVARALAASERLVADARALGYAPAESEARRLHAAALRRSGDPARAAPEARRAALLAESARDDRAAARAWLERVAGEGERGAWREALDAAEQAEASVARLGDPALVAPLDLLRGLALANLGRSSEARAALEASLRARERSGADASPALTALGDLARRAGDLDRALALHTRALALDRARYGETHPEIARHHHNLGGVLRRMGRADEARARYLAALRIEETALGQESPEAGLTRNSLGLLALEAGALDEAATQLAAAARVLDARAHPDRALVRVNLALLAARQGRHADSARLAAEALAIDEPAVGPSHERVARALKLQGRALAALGRAPAARAALERARSIAAARAADSADAAAIVREADEALAALDAAAVPARARRQGVVAPRRSARVNDAPSEAGAGAGVERVEQVAVGTADAAVASDAGSASDAAGAAPARPRWEHMGGSGGYGPVQRWQAE